MVSRAEMHKLRDCLEELKENLLEGHLEEVSVEELIDNISVMQGSNEGGQFAANLEAIHTMLSGILSNLGATRRIRSAI